MWLKKGFEAIKLGMAGRDFKLYKPWNSNSGRMDILDIKRKMQWRY
jgi:hypothetical protein